MSLNLPQKLPEESEKNYQYFLSYCFMGSDRSIPKLSKQLEGYGSSEKRLYQLYNAHQWCDRAAAFDTLMRDFMGEVITEKIGGDIINYHRSFENTFKIVHRLNLLMLSKISELINDSDLKSQKGYIAAIKGLSQIMASLSVSIRNNHESWGILLGIEKIKDKIDTMSN